MCCYFLFCLSFRMYKHETKTPKSQFGKFIYEQNTWKNDFVQENLKIEIPSSISEKITNLHNRFGPVAVNLGKSTVV